METTLETLVVTLIFLGAVALAARHIVRLFSSRSNPCYCQGIAITICRSASGIASRAQKKGSPRE